MRTRKQQPPLVEDPTILRIAERLEAKLRAAFLAAIAALQAKIDLSWLADAIAAGVITERLAQAIATLPQELAPAVHIVEQAFQAAGEAAAGALSVALRVSLRFDLSNPAILEWQRLHAAELVTNITDEMRAQVNARILTALEMNLTRDQLARTLRDGLGLTTRQAAAVDAYRLRLLADGVGPQRVEELVAKYTTRLIRQRAALIAQTELVRGATAGQEALWQQAIQQGVMDRDLVRKQWMVRSPDACDVVCLPLSNMYPADLPKVGEPFIVPDTASAQVGEELDGPPAHPACRCLVRLLYLD